VATDQVVLRMERPAQFASWTTDVVVPPSTSETALRFEEVVLVIHCVRSILEDSLPGFAAGPVP